MSFYLTIQSVLLQALGWTILHSFWQMGFIWICWRLVSPLVGSHRPGMRHLLQLICLTGGLLLFVFTLYDQYLKFHLQLTELGRLPLTTWIVDDSNTQSITIADRVFEPLLRLVPFCSAAYLMVLSFLFVRLVHAFMYTQKLKTAGLSDPGPTFNTVLDVWKQKLRLQIPVQVYLSELIDVPATVGWLKPVILIPVALVNKLSPEQAESVLLHELAHILRRDFLINILVSVLEMVFFFNPFAMMLVSGIRRDREMFCDDFVVRRLSEPAGYVQALLLMEKMRRETMPVFSLAATGRDGQLLQRVKRILHVSQRQAMYPQQLMAFVMVGILLCFVAWVNPGEKRKPSVPVAAASFVSAEPSSFLQYSPVARVQKQVLKPQKNDIIKRKAGIETRGSQSSTAGTVPDYFLLNQFAADLPAKQDNIDETPVSRNVNTPRGFGNTQMASTYEQALQSYIRDIERISEMRKNQPLTEFRFPHEELFESIAPGVRGSTHIGSGIEGIEKPLPFVFIQDGGFRVAENLAFEPVMEDGTTARGGITQGIAADKPTRIKHKQADARQYVQALLELAEMQKQVWLDNKALVEKKNRTEAKNATRVRVRYGANELKKIRQEMDEFQIFTENRTPILIETDQTPKDSRNRSVKFRKGQALVLMPDPNRQPIALDDIQLSAPMFAWPETRVPQKAGRVQHRAPAASEKESQTVFTIKVKQGDQVFEFEWSGQSKD